MLLYKRVYHVVTIVSKHYDDKKNRCLKLSLYYLSTIHLDLAIRLDATLNNLNLLGCGQDECRVSDYVSSFNYHRRNGFHVSCTSNTYYETVK